MSSQSELRVIAIDAGYIRPKLAAIHLVVDNGRAAFVDTGTSQSVPHMLEALLQAGLTPADVDYVFLTHVHLDHAGGAGTLMQLLPAAQCVLHPRGARHMIDPSKLTAASKEVYGEEKFAKLYGELPSIPAERVLTVEDGQRLTLGQRELEFIHTPGHALHHYCIVDRVGGIIFSGDTFGLSYRELDTERGAFIMPISTPSQFDPEAAHQSIDRLMSYAPRAIYLTHYSRVEASPRLARDLHELLDGYVAIAHRHAASANRTQLMIDDMYAYIDERLDRHGVRADAGFRRSVLDGDIRLNVQGLEVWLRSQTVH
ncbi:MAG: MBL fold metallo-hydrolase [Candidatus Obscuribacterales bacterium]|nr:MBL fold metallo-hydrolase [Steroidobacteraceae bacterium]